VAHLIGVKKWNGVKSVSLLKGLFLYRRDGESSDLRILYLPFHLRWPVKKESDSKSFRKELADGR